MLATKTGGVGMVGKLIRVMVWLALAVVLAVTNPSLTEYGKWLHQEALSQSSGFLDTLSVNLFLRPGEIVNNTTRQNYVLVSTYKTDIGGQRLEFLGLFQHFIPLGRQG